MTVDITLDPIGRTFIPTVLRDPRFRSNGFLRGDSPVGYHWVVVNPRRHPLYVWRKRYSIHWIDANHYERTAVWLDAAAFSNGPMMEYPAFGDLVKLLIVKVGTWYLIALFGTAIVTALFTGGASLALFIGWCLAAGAGIGAGIIRAFMEWGRGGRPFGFVKGDKEWINDPGMGYNGDLVSFGRGQSTDFASYRLTRGHAPAGYSEAMGGVIPLVINYAPRSATAGSPDYNQAYDNLSQRGGISSWALIPLGDQSTTTHPPGDDGRVAGPLTASELQGIDLVMPEDSTPLDGVIMVAGKRLGRGEIAGYYASIGARDAIALDGSDSVMVGSKADSYLGALPWYKDGLQKYGFFAR